MKDDTKVITGRSSEMPEVCCEDTPIDFMVSQHKTQWYLVLVSYIRLENIIFPKKQIIMWYVLNFSIENISRNIVT